MSLSENISPARISTALLILLALLTALDAVAIDMYLPAMPAIAQSLQVDAGRIQQTLVVFLAGLAIGQALYGPLLDSYGRRAPLVAGMLLFILGSAVAALATSAEMLTAARFIQALGAAAGLVTPRAIVSDICTVTESARIYSILMQVMMVAPILAPLIGSLVLQTASWHILFWLLTFFGVIGLIGCLYGLPETLPAEQRVRLEGKSVIAGYTTILINKNFMAFTLAGSFILGSLFTYISASAFIFTHTFSLTPSQFSYLFAVNSLMLIFGGYLSNMLLKRGYSEKQLTLIGIIIHAMAAASLLLMVLNNAASLTIYALLIALAIGALGLVFGNLTALTMQQAQQQAGVASSMMGSIQYFLSSIIGFIYSKFAFGLEGMPLVMLACSIIAIVFVLKVKTTY